MLRLGVSAEEDDAVVEILVGHSQPECVAVPIAQHRQVVNIEPDVPEVLYSRTAGQSIVARHRNTSHRDLIAIMTSRRGTSSREAPGI